MTIVDNDDFTISYFLLYEILIGNINGKYVCKIYALHETISIRFYNANLY